MGGYYFMGTELLFWIDEKIQDTESGDTWWQWMYLMPLNYTVEDAWNGQFYAMYTLSQ